MDFLKIIFLFSAAVHVHLSNAKPPQPWQYNTRKVNSSPDEQNCFCYPDGQLPIVEQLLDTQNNGLERVVIYLYKNDETNEIKMYTPSTEKQMLIPDMPYEAGDELVNISPGNIYTLIYNNPNRIKVYNNRFETLNPAVSHSLPIGLKVGAIEHVSPKADNTINPLNISYGNEYILDGSTNEPIIDHVNEPQQVFTSSSANAGPENINPNIYFPTKSNDYSNLETSQPYWMSDNMNYPYALSQAIPENTQSLTGYPQAFPSDPQVISENPPLIGHLQASSSPQAIAEHSPLTSYLQAFPNNPQALPDYLQNLQISDKPHSYSGNLQPSLDKLQANPLSGGLDQLIVYTFQTNQGSYFPSGSKDINKSHLTRYVTFNVWFNQQMERFQNINLPDDIKSIDSNFLRLLVLKTFSDNNIYIRADGAVTDSKGTVIDVGNLELRPLLLGETLNPQILQNLHKPITLPKHLPYLEGILVTIVSPPQILGIIPLGKTYLHQTSYTSPSLSELSVNGTKIYVNDYGNPKSFMTSSSEPYTLTVKELYSPIKAKVASIDYYTYSDEKEEPFSGTLYSDVYSKSKPIAYPHSIVNKESQAGESEVNYWTSGPYSTASNLPIITANYVESLAKRRKLPDAKIEHHIEPPTKNRKRGKGLSKSTEMKEGVVEVTPEPFTNINTSESGRRFPAPSLKGVMKTLLYLLDDLPSRRDLKNSTEGIDIVEESESKNDKEGPDFRIIGGNAATGSGTPLNNKGRSGYTEYI